MATETSARVEVLQRIRKATGTVSADADRTAAIDAEWRAIRREYIQAPALSGEELLELLEDRLRDYDAGVYRCEAANLSILIGKILEERGKQLMALPEGIPVEWLPEGRRFLVDDRQGSAALDTCDGVLTTATLAIAQTGTIVLQDVAGQGRRAATLLPDYHLCLVPADSVVQSVPEAIRLLERTSALATTFFSGPSATADIEMTRIKGVHGPRFVDVILIL